MIRSKSFVSVLVAGVVAAGLSVVGVPAASAGSAASSGVTITSSRSFPKVNTARRDVLKESVSTDGDGASWGGVDSLDVPQTKSQAERDAEAAAKKAEEERKAAEEAARQEAARLAEAQAASRSSSRTSLTTTQSQGVDLPAAASGSAVVSYAAEFQGVPYVIGGTTPAGFDCSGFTQFVYAKFGISLPRVDNDQRTWAQSHGTRVSNPQPGDLMWLPGHVGIYVGNGLMIHAPRPGKSVSIVPVYSSSFEYYHILSD